ncbi:type I polyketide synthase [Xenorhabdus bovienii]|uniref:type I polyketide synthase n=1 Tax=Xenorhabdus bovienii TaxID=40576 RepID=UPI0023B2BB24|nr:type I polyketide synthase [Xenorhabdus bovienii]MDE9454422.1 SDR family NAD(P)-dependent oxidoreductase [Xenorhabdus bovienii]MDE9563055.1 SDR family NAD(P)-dependent oxidoreductase [Xenorhabdus bovienii]
MSETYFLHDRKVRGDIAIVGMASHFPDAPNLYKFWENIIGKKDSLTDVSTMLGDEYWQKEDFYDPNPAVADKTYGHRAGFVPPIDFDPVEFKIPPAIIDSISTAQLFALYVAKQAMLDAGLVGQENSRVDRDRIGVILGGAGNGNTSFSLASRQQAPYLRKIMIKSGLSEKVASDIIERMHGMYLEWNEDSFPGFLGNVACGRIASYFDLGGTSYMVDAACASSLAAIKAAIGELHSGSCDAVLTGGVNLENSIFSFLCFSKTPALSKSNLSRPFDQSADGMMLGDGVGMLVLKRLEDAELDGDRIYAVIKSIEASSDGRAKSIFAPRLEGQAKALRRAYASAGLSPNDIQLVEAHGTGTASGDDTELKSLHTVFGECQVPAKSVAIGSIKSQIGHTRCAAGAASMMKVALALHHKVLPPTLNVDKPTNLLKAENSPFYVNSEARPWLRSFSSAPRRAALSAFGFGGTNFHVILEEYEKNTHGRYRLNESPWIMLFKGHNPAELLAQCEEALIHFSGNLPDIAIRQYLEQQDIDSLQPQQARVLFVSQSAEQTVELLSITIKQLQQNSAHGWEHPRGIYYQPQGKMLDGKIVALFPGQGSQYVNMARDVANDYPEMRQSLETLDDVSISELGHELSSVIYPVPTFSDDERQVQQQRLTDTANAQPALGAISAGYFNILKGMGFAPDFVAGHSYGEVTALWAAGVLSDKDFHRVSLVRGWAAASASDHRGADTDAGAMLAASLNPAQRAQILERYTGIIIANDNSQQQVVFGGATSLIHQLHDELKKRDVHCRILPVSAAFHTAFIQPAYQPYRERLAGINFQSPQCRLFSSATAEPYGNSSQAIRELLAEQLIKPVQFRQTIEAIYQQGGRLFVEVGPKGVLGKLVADILKDKEHEVISVNPNDKGEDRLQFARAQAKLLAEGVKLREINQHIRPQPIAEDKSKRLTFRMSGGFYLSQKNKARRQRALRDGDSAIVEQFIAESAPVPMAPVMPLHSQKEVNIKEEHSGKEVKPTKEVYSDNGVKPTKEVYPDNEVKPTQEVHPTKEVVVEKVENKVEKIAENKTISAQFIQQNMLTIIQRRESTMEQNNQLSENVDVNMLNGLLQAQQVMSQLHQQFQANQKDYIQLLGMLLDKQYTLLETCKDHQNLPSMLSSLSQSVQLLDKNLELYHSNHEHYFMAQQSLFQSGQVTPMIAPTHRTSSPVVDYSALAKVTTSATVAPAPAVTPVPAVKVDPVLVQASTPVDSMKEITPVRSAVPEMPAMASVAATTVESAKPTVSAAPVDQPEPVITETKITVLDPEVEKQIQNFEQITEEKIIGQLIAIVSDRTGYPQDMITPEMDLEADLGIDSIKRLEIFGAMFDAFSTDAGIYHDTSKSQDLENLDIDSLSNISKMAVFFNQMIKEAIRDLRQQGEGEVEPENAASAVEFYTESGDREKAERNEPVQAGSEATLRSFGFVTSTTEASEVAGVKKPLAESQWVTPSVVQPALNNEEESFTDSSVSRFAVVKHPLSKPDCLQGIFAFPRRWLVIDEEKTTVGDTGVADIVKALKQQGQQVVVLTLSQSLGDEATLDAAVTDIEREHGTIEGVIYLQAPKQGVKNLADVFSAREYLSVETTFLLAKRLQGSLNHNDLQSGYFMVVMRSDGELLTSGREYLPIVSAGIPGLTKSLNIEWKNVFCRTVDIDARVKGSDVAKMVLEELQDSRTDLAEVGRGINGERMTLALTEEKVLSASSTANQVNADDVLVVTGGARGITAQCVIELAKQSQAAFILLGRTDITAPLPSWAEGKTTLADRKAAAIAYLQAQGEKLTPVKIDSMLGRLAHIEEINQTLQEIRLAGGRAIYLDCDITDSEQMKIVLTNAQQQFGQVTGFVHGAGNLADKRIEKKTRDDLHSVFNVKVKGLENLCRELDCTSLRHIMLFSSVSGFFGNAGQTDYSLANETLNKFIHLPLKGKNSRIIRSVNWGPWDGGMVSDVLKRAYDAQNMVIIPLKEGTQRFVREFGDTRSLQVTIGGENYKAANKIKALGTGEQIDRLLTLEENPFLHHHVIDGKPVLPITAAIAWMAKVCEDRFPGYQLETVANFRVLKGILFDGKQTGSYRVTWVPSALHESSDGRLALDFVIASEQRKHYQATLILSLQCREVEHEPVQIDLNTHVPQTVPFYGKANGQNMLFHGELFHGIQQVVHVGNDYMILKCCVASVAPEVQGQFSTNLFNLFINDVALQLPVLWLLQRDQAALPSAIEKLEQYAELKFGQEFYASVKIKHQMSTEIITDIIFYDEQGRIYSQIHNARFTVFAELRNLFFSDKNGHDE